MGRLRIDRHERPPSAGDRKVASDVGGSGAPRLAKVRGLPDEGHPALGGEDPARRRGLHGGPDEHDFAFEPDLFPGLGSADLFGPDRQGQKTDTDE